MSEVLREFDDSIGRCVHCDELVFKSEGWCLPFNYMFSQKAQVAHIDCDSKESLKASQI